MYYLSFERKRFTPLLWLFPLGFALLLPLSAAGAVCLLREWRKYALVGIVILVTVLNMLIFFVDERFRLPLAPFLIFIAAVGLVKGARLMADRSQWIVRRGALGLLMVDDAGAPGDALMHVHERARGHILAFARPVSISRHPRSSVTGSTGEASDNPDNGEHVGL